MERAVLVSRAPLLDTLDWTGYDRLYLGNGYCQRLIPTPDQLRSALDRADDAHIPLTLVTPPVTDNGLDDLGPVLDLLPKGAEVVANDWGVIDLVAEAGRLQPVVGGLLHKQKRGPRIMMAKDLLPPEAWDRFRTSNMDVVAMREILALYGIKRVEVENPFQGVSLDLAGGEKPLFGSLHHPYVCVTMSRYCLLALASTRQGLPEWGIYPCSRMCTNSSFQLDHPTMGVPLYLKGCAVFVKNDALPGDKELKDMGIDRTVVSQIPPA